MISLLKSYPYHFVRTILSVPFCPIPFCPYTILSIPFCPYHFVRCHFVLEPLNLLHHLPFSSIIDDKIRPPTSFSSLCGKKIRPPTSSLDPTTYKNLDPPPPF